MSDDYNLTSILADLTFAQILGSSMTFEISRRRMLVGSTTALAMTGASRETLAGTQNAPSNPAGLELLKSTDGVNTPPKGAGIMKFSFADPEPSIRFAGLLIGFQIITFENSYSIDPERTTVSRNTDEIIVRANGLRYAGGTMRRSGTLEARLRRMVDGAIEWSVRSELDVDIKAIKTIVRGLPRGRISPSAEAWQELGDSEKVFEYPALMGGMATPFVTIDGKDGQFWGLSALQTEVRPARFAFIPGPDGYKVELIYEAAGWERKSRVTSCGWRIFAASNFETVAKRHFETVEANWNIQDLAKRNDTPEWAKEIACVISLHGAHWTGYVFNDFRRQLEILRWVAKHIDPRNVLVFLVGWDGRYYWDYPKFSIGEECGGEAAFAELIREGKKLGYHFALMFGSNIANPDAPGFSGIADAQVQDIYGATYPSNYVDWDGDRKGEPSMVFMNLGVASWRAHLRARIVDMISRYRLDAYFLDICGFWENNSKADMLIGLKALVDDLTKVIPGVMPIAEMQFDAQMGFIPWNHVPRYSLYPQASYNKVVSFNHLSWPAPGSDSTGVHEYGFNQYKGVTIDQEQVPTITFVDDTFIDHRQLVMRDLANAHARFKMRYRRPK
jgi:hypothetical protein